MEYSSVTKQVDTQWWFYWLIGYEYEVLNIRRGEDRNNLGMSSAKLWSAEASYLHENSSSFEAAYYTVLI